MILVTGAAGQTGRAVIRALHAKDIPVRAMVHRADQAEQIKALGAAQVVSGDMLSRTDMENAMRGVNSVYFICSAENPAEYEMGRIALEAAHACGVVHFIYHSVLHSLLRELPHHALKNDVENLLTNSGMWYTILQPAVLMQNLQMSAPSLRADGVWKQKFFCGKATQLCMVDLQDVAEAAAVVAADPAGHVGATYELCGLKNYSAADILADLSSHYMRPITSQFIPDQALLGTFADGSEPDYRTATMLKMFRHYNDASFLGSPVTLRALLGRPPHSLPEYLRREHQI